MAAAFQVIAFAVFAFIAIVGALGMATTMSMFRSGIFLMASFIGVAGLFILLSADLIGLLQIMMYIGGMLVMILFMVLFMPDPGGAMMVGMDISLLERWFSKGLMPHGAKQGHEEHEQHKEHALHQKGNGESEDHSDGKDHGDEGMEGMDMSMVTPVRPLAAWLAAAIGAVLVSMLVLRPAWRIVDGVPEPDSARRIGHLLMEKYMVAFEGAGVLILIGIFGAVLLARPSTYPDAPSRSAKVAIDEKPMPIADDQLTPIAASGPNPSGGSGK